MRLSQFILPCLCVLLPACSGNLNPNSAHDTETSPPTTVLASPALFPHPDNPDSISYHTLDCSGTSCMIPQGGMPSGPETTSLLGNPIPIEQVRLKSGVNIFPDHRLADFYTSHRILARGNHAAAAVTHATYNNSGNYQIRANATGERLPGFAALRDGTWTGAVTTMILAKDPATWISTATLTIEGATATFTISDTEPYSGDPGSLPRTRFPALAVNRDTSRIEFDSTNLSVEGSFHDTEHQTAMLVFASFNEKIVGAALLHRQAE